jgi:hypothetical protein
MQHLAAEVLQILRPPELATAPTHPAGATAEPAGAAAGATAEAPVPAPAEPAAGPEEGPAEPPPPPPLGIDVEAWLGSPRGKDL